MGINAFETWLRLSALCRGREEIFLDERLESGTVEDRWEEKPYCRHGSLRDDCRRTGYRAWTPSSIARVIAPSPPSPYFLHREFRETIFEPGGKKNHNDGGIVSCL